MGTTITIKVVSDASTILVQELMSKAFNQFDRIVKLYSRFDEHSQLCDLNRQSGKWVEVSEEFSYLIAKMLELADATNGVYDPTIIDILEAYGYSSAKDFDSRLNDPSLESKIARIVATRPSYKEIKFDQQSRRVKLVLGQRLELGGIGKGYALDCAAQELSQLDSYLIDAGGDVRLAGNNKLGGPWKVGLKHRYMDSDGFIGMVELTAGSICASGSWARRVGKFHHIINPVSGNPHNDSLTAYTYAKTALIADSWCTPLFLLGKQGLKKLPKGVAGVVIDNQNEAAIGEGFPKITQLD